MGYDSIIRSPYYIVVARFTPKTHLLLAEHIVQTEGAPPGSRSLLVVHRRGHAREARRIPAVARKRGNFPEADAVEGRFVDAGGVPVAPQAGVVGVGRLRHEHERGSRVEQAGSCQASRRRQRSSGSAARHLLAVVTTSVFPSSSSFSSSHSSPV